MQLRQAPHLKIDGDIVFVPLSKGKRKKHMYAKIDLDDYERVANHKWFPKFSGKTWYAYATSNIGLASHHRNLHLFVARAHVGERYDHINGDGLDCRKENLRLATAQQNAQNAFKTTSTHVTSIFKGVSLSPSSGRWIAQIKLNGVPQLLGLFDSDADAARAYDDAALRLFGDFAKTNAMMGLFDAGAPNRSECHSAPGSKFVQPSQIDQKAQWERYLESGDLYLDSDMDPKVMDSLAKVKDYRLRQKIAARHREKAA